MEGDDQDDRPGNGAPAVVLVLEDARRCGGRLARTRGMGRKLLVRSNFLPYHVTARANNRDRFPVEMPLAWKIVSDSAYLIIAKYDAEVHSLVLMQNHLHMLISVPEFDLGIVMNEFMRDVSRTMNLFSGRTGHVFGGPHYRSLITSATYFRNAYQYVYRNPVKAGICDAVEDYPWSTLHGMLGSSRLPFPVVDPRCGHGAGFLALDPDRQLDWLNTAPHPIINHAIGMGLRAPIFGPEAVRSDGKVPHWREILEGAVSW